MNITWDDVWQTLAATAGFTVIILITTLCLSTKNIDYYYIDSSQTNGIGSCVKSHWTWHSDSVVFCSDNKDTTLDFLNKANNALKAAR